MYFLTGNHLDCQAGYGLIQKGRAQLKADGGTRGRRFLAQGAELLRSGAYDVPRGDPSQRRAMFEGAWLALGHSAHGDLEAACEVGRIVADRLDLVCSPRSAALLHQLAADLRRRPAPPTAQRARAQLLAGPGARPRRTRPVDATWPLGSGS
ncbi:hypothetical protein GCM10010346_57670 [Streptomyces chryseus]|uniref:Uncharacterized protein n=1 Tax=Streptomyces chryseus TaxID=68186 RepID=A0ABQ3E909_9ACTN|nr:hypothetical protein GCM10010346_57670 [Streptomyces chryseus]